jgi:hypothetical protein
MRLAQMVTPLPVSTRLDLPGARVGISASKPLPDHFSDLGNYFCGLRWVAPVMAAFINRSPNSGP